MTAAIRKKKKVTKETRCLLQLMTMMTMTMRSLNSNIPKEKRLSNFKTIFKDTCSRHLKKTQIIVWTCLCSTTMLGSTSASIKIKALQLSLWVRVRGLSWSPIGCVVTLTVCAEKI